MTTEELKELDDRLHAGNVALRRLNQIRDAIKVLKEPGQTTINIRDLASGRLVRLDHELPAKGEELKPRPDELVLGPGVQLALVTALQEELAKAADEFKAL